MNVELVIAGVICLAVAVGHASTGLVWVLPRLSVDHMPSTPFGPPVRTAGMIRFTFHFVTIVLVTFAVLLMTLAWAEDSDTKTLLLRGFAAFWLAAFALALWVARSRLRDLWRLPAPFLFVILAVLCLKGSA